MPILCWPSANCWRGTFQAPCTSSLCLLTSNSPPNSLVSFSSPLHLQEVMDILGLLRSLVSTARLSILRHFILREWVKCPVWNRHHTLPMNLHITFITTRNATHTRLPRLEVQTWDGKNQVCNEEKKVLQWAAASLHWSWGNRWSSTSWVTAYHFKRSCFKENLFRKKTPLPGFIKQKQKIVILEDRTQIKECFLLKKKTSGHTILFILFT